MALEILNFLGYSGACTSKNIHFYFFKNYNILVRLDYMFIAFVYLFNNLEHLFVKLMSSHILQVQ